MLNGLPVGATKRQCGECRMTVYMIPARGYVLSLSILMERASFSTGGPSSSTGKSWTCLWGWLAPLKSPPAAFGQLYPHDVATSRTVVESEEPPPSLLRRDEEQIYLHEVRGKKGRRLRLKLCVHDQSTVGADASTHKHTRSLFVTSKKWCGTTEYLLNYARWSIETRLRQRARGGHAPKSRTRGPRTRP